MDTAKELLAKGARLIGKCKWLEAIEVLKSAADALSKASTDPTISSCRKRVLTLLWQAYDQAGLFVSAMEATEALKMECQKSRILMLQKMRRLKEANAELKLLEELEEEWVDLVKAERKNTLSISRPSLADLETSVLDRVVSQLIKWKYLCNNPFRTCKAFQALASHHLGVKLDSKRLTLASNFRTGCNPCQTICSHLREELGQAVLKRLELDHVSFDPNVGLLKIEGLEWLKLTFCENVQIDLTGVRELVVCLTEFSMVTGSLDHLTDLSFESFSLPSPLLDHLAKKRPRLAKLSIERTSIYVLNWIRDCLTSLSILWVHWLEYEMDWPQITRLKDFGIMWSNLIELKIMHAEHYDGFESIAPQLIKCERLLFESNPATVPPSIWPPNLKYLKVTTTWFSSVLSSLPSSLICLQLKSDDNIQFIDNHAKLKFIILESFSYGTHGQPSTLRQYARLMEEGVRLIFAHWAVICNPEQLFPSTSNSILLGIVDSESLFFSSDPKKQWDNRQIPFRLSR